MSDTKSFTSSPHMDQALAGFTAGMISTTFTHPLDMIKIRFQVDASKRSDKRPWLGGTIRSFRNIMSNEGGIAGLYRGVTPSALGAAASWGFYFWGYSFIKKHMTKDEHGKLQAWQHMVASTEAGAVTAILTNPIWVIKTRMCTTTRTTPGAYQSFLQGFYRLVTEEGLRGMYRGMVPALFGVSHGGIQFMAYEEMKKWRNERRHASGETAKSEWNAQLSTPEYLVMATSSKIVAAVTTYPYQVLRSRLQNRETRDEYRGVVDCIRKIKSVEGMRGFYKGLAPSVIRVLPGTCITFLVYENMTQYFKKHAT
ncbi:mitochondrial carrier [Hesseltinella vesiculosa]|uniref:Mitochondrial carrier n=1 Tax=Hesseltinella vesiculosa TaxID=101127 RepID=A0A1X2GX90_9FUNG|nr:mitochondrial carrier [Hesseltinella vesiculosa]